MVDFTVTKKEQVLIHSIAIKAARQLKTSDGYLMGSLDHTVLQVEMDLTATHANGNPLRLDELLNTDGYDFLHDILGIMENLDRKTGKLQNCFSPRFSQ